MIELDGRRLEGGGQILRTALALSGLTQKGFRIKNIRNNRPTAGLKAQHLHAVRASAEWCQATVEGDTLGSETLEFIPNGLMPRNISVDIGTAGSVSLILQALLPLALFGDRKITLSLTGGTDVRWSPSIDYFSHVFAPQLERLGLITVKVLRRGYYPRGGGKVEVVITPRHQRMSFKNTNQFVQGLVKACKPFDQLNRGDIVQIKGVSHASASLRGRRVAERQSRAASFYLSHVGCSVSILKEYNHSLSPGSGISLWAQYNSDLPLALGTCALGEKKIAAEEVGKDAGERLRAEIDGGKGLDRNMADQIILFMGLLPGSKIGVFEVSQHCKTNCKTVEAFLPVKFSLKKQSVYCRSKKLP